MSTVYQRSIVPYSFIKKPKYEKHRKYVVAR